MHLITEDPTKGKNLSLIRKASSSMPIDKPKKDSMATAIKNKIVDKVSDVMAMPARKWHESKSRGYDKQYKFAKEYQAKAKSGTLSNKDRAIMNQLKGD